MREGVPAVRAVPCADARALRVDDAVRHTPCLSAPHPAARRRVSVPGAPLRSTPRRAPPPKMQGAPGFVRTLGRAARTVGRTLDHVGVVLQDKAAYVERRE